MTVLGYLLMIPALLGVALILYLLVWTMLNVPGFALKLGVSVAIALSFTGGLWLITH